MQQTVMEQRLNFQSSEHYSNYIKKFIPQVKNHETTAKFSTNIGKGA